MRVAIAALLALTSFTAAGTARAAEQLAVVILVEGEPAQSDSLAEIAIAHLAESRGGLVGLRELRGRLPAAPDGGSLEACLARGECIPELGHAAGAQRALVGTLKPTPSNEWQLELSLADTASAAIVQRTQRTLPRDFAPLADGLRAAIDELLPPPPPKVDLSAPTPAPVVIQTPPQTPVQPISRATIAGISLAGVAVAALVTGAVLGAVGSSAAEGTTRADAQNDLNTRTREVQVANGLFVAGGVLAVASATVLIWRWR
jgi:hypothetical protein